MQPIAQRYGRVPPEDHPVREEVPLLQGREGRAVHVHDVCRPACPSLTRRDRVQRPPARVVDGCIAWVIRGQREGRRSACGHVRVRHGGVGQLRGTAGGD